MTQWSWLPKMAAVACLALLGGACEDEGATPQLTNFSTPPDDTPRPPVAEPPPPLVLPDARDICNAGSIRCRATGSPQIEVCGVPPDASTEVTRWIPDTCPEDEICHEGQCQSFVCTPGRPACSGLTRRGMCTETGDGLFDEEDCEGESVCRGGACVDLCESAARDRSYIGCNYLMVDLPNPLLTEGTTGSPFAVVVANTNELLGVKLSVHLPDGLPEQLLDSATVANAEGEGLEQADPVTLGSVVRDAKGEVVERPTGSAENIEVPPGGFATLLLPRRMVPSRASGIYALSRRLVSSRPVVAYQFNPYCCNFSFTNDASLLLPIEALGNEYVFTGAPDWTPGLEPPQFFGMGLTIVAPEDDTHVELTLPNSARVYPPSSGRLVIPRPRTDEPAQVEVVLNKGEVLHLESRSDEQTTSDMTGARIVSDKPLAAFSTHACTFIPHSFAACDHLEEQLIPTDTWGSQYILSPPARRSRQATEVTYWHIVAGELETRVQLTQGFDELFLRAPFASTILDCRLLRPSDTNNRAFVLAPGQDCMLTSQHPIAVETTQPVMISGFLSSEQATASGRSEGTGDPSMFLLPPVSQFRTDYMFLTPETYALDFVTVVVPKDAAGAMTLDGLPIDPKGEGISGQSVGGSNFILMHVPVSDGAHRIECTAPFGLLVYAYDQYVSYAYTGGLNLIKRR